MSRFSPPVVIAVAVAVVVWTLWDMVPGVHDRGQESVHVPETGPVDLADDVSRFVAGQPRTSGYVIPTERERTTVAAGARRVLDGDANGAAEILHAVGYAVRRRRDTASRRSYFEVYDRSTPRRGWGSVFVDATRPARLGIEVPHPGADRSSELLGVALFRKVRGSVLVVAGANRNAAPDRRADVAHAPHTVFESVHEVVIASRLPAMQLHGYADQTAPGSDLVVSAGPDLRGPFAERVAAEVEDAGFAVCRPWLTRCPGLEATTNVQARWVADHGGDFAHIEASWALRSSADQRDRAATALAQVALDQTASRATASPGLGSTDPLRSSRHGDGVR